MSGRREPGCQWCYANENRPYHHSKRFRRGQVCNRPRKVEAKPEQFGRIVVGKCQMRQTGPGQYGKAPRPLQRIMLTQIKTALQSGRSSSKIRRPNPRCKRAHRGHVPKLTEHDIGGPQARLPAHIPECHHSCWLRLGRPVQRNRCRP